MNQQQIARKTAQGVFWNYASFGLGKGLVFITTAVLARLLAPEQFGLVAMATLAINYLAIFKDLGLGAALIQRRADVDRAANTVFTLNLLLGVVLTGLGFLLAPLAAAYFRETAVTPLLRWLSLTFLLNALGAVHVVRLQRELNFRRKLIPDLGRAITKGAVSIGLALMGWGVWSLVVGQLVGAGVAALLGWVAFPWLPRFRLDRQLSRQMLTYGLSVIGVSTLAVALDNLDYLIIGRLFGNAELGIYTLAFRLPELLVLNALWVLAAAVFPAYAIVQNDPKLLRNGFLSAVRYVSLYTFPVCLGLVIVADPLVRVAFGEQWLAAIPIVRVLALFVLVRSLVYNAGDVYKATDRVNVLVRLELLNMLILLPALLLGTRFGLLGVAVGHLLAACCRSLADLLVAQRLVGVHLWDIGGSLKTAVLGGAALLLVTAPLLLATEGWAPLPRLLLLAGFGGAAYVATIWNLEREMLRGAIQVVLPSK